MPNIFPPIDTQNPQVAQGVEEGTPVPQSAILGTVAAPSRAKLAYDTANRGVEAAQAQLAADTPKKYDYSAHSVLGNVGHVLGRFGNIAGDILDPEATSLIPHSDLWNEKRLAQDQEGVDKAKSGAESAGRESDVVDNEQANRDAEQGKFDAEAPQRDATLAATQASTEHTQQMTKPLNAADAATLNALYNTKAFSQGMTPEEAQRLTEAHKTIAEMKARTDEFTQRAQQHAQDHADKEKDLALQRGIAQTNHQDAMSGKEQAATDKANKPYQDVIDDVEQAREFAKQNTGYGDYGLVMKFVDASKPKTGFRFNNVESGQIYGAASIADKFKRAYESGAHGTLLAPEQRSQILHALEVPYNAAQKHIGGGTSSDTGAPPAGAKVIDFTQLGNNGR